MAEDSGEIGFGTAVGYGDTQGGSFTDVSELVDVKLPKIEVNDVDLTHHGITDFFRDFTPGLGNAGEIVMKLLFDKAQQDALYGLIRTTKWWRINFPLAEGEITPSCWKCQGYIKGVENMNPLDDKMEADFTVKLRGKPAWMSGA